MPEKINRTPVGDVDPGPAELRRVRRSGTAKIHVVLRDKQNPFDFSLLQHV